MRCVNKYEVNHGKVVSVHLPPPQGVLRDRSSAANLERSKCNNGLLVPSPERETSLALKTELLLFPNSSVLLLSTLIV